MSLLRRGTTAATLAFCLLAAPAARSHDPNADPMNHAAGLDPWRIDPATMQFGSRPDGHAPIGVMGDHMHHEGGVMLSYRYGYMSMNGNLDGTNPVSTAEVLQQFPVSPTSMTMQMHMLGVMWAPLEQVTLAAMLPWTIREMDHETRSGRTFTTRAEGLGDLTVSALVRLLARPHHRAHLNLGTGFPTGRIGIRDQTPMGLAVLPYPMQIGSGTYDLLPGITYTGDFDRFSWGGQAQGTVRVGTNSRSYRLGNAYELTGWGAVALTSWLSVSFRVAWEQWFNVVGADPALNPRMVPTAAPNLRAGKRLDLLGGFNFEVPGGPLKGQRLALEAGAPAYQSLAGPQLATDFRLVVGWQYGF